MMTGLLTSGLRHLDFRGKEKITAYTCPKDGVIVTEIFGFHVKLDLSDPVQRKMYCGTYKPDQFSLLSRYIRRGMNFVDAGCNLGYYTLMFASFAHEFAGDPGRVYSFEPGPYPGEKLVETINYNAILNVHFEQVALGSKTEEESPLYVSRQPGTHQRSMLPQNGFMPIKVPIKRLDDSLTERRVGKVDLLRLDVNGYEPDVLRGASEYLKDRRIAAILCAFDDLWLERSGGSRAALYELLAFHGFGSPAARAAMEGGAKSLLLTLAEPGIH